MSDPAIDAARRALADREPSGSSWSQRPTYARDTHRASIAREFGVPEAALSTVRPATVADGSVMDLRPHTMTIAADCHVPLVRGDVREVEFIADPCVTLEAAQDRAAEWFHHLTRAGASALAAAIENEAGRLIAVLASDDWQDARVNDVMRRAQNVRALNTLLRRRLASGYPIRRVCPDPLVTPVGPA